MLEKTRNVLHLHFGLFLAEAICISAFVVEISRALSGNILSWAYVIEWPILGTYAVYMWRKLLKEERSGESAPPAPVVDDDPRLAAWNDYLARVHSNEHSPREVS